MTLQLTWFVIISVLWAGFFVLEGFDFGVGMLHQFVGRNDTERRVAINTIGPFWDGNEVWLIVGGAGLFAAFPGWYATMFSALYLPLLLILVVLMIRGTAFEYRGKGHSQKWRNWWSWGLVISSAGIPLLLGVGVGDLLAGLPIDQNAEYTGNFFQLLTPYGLLTGITLTVLSLAHGATFLALKTTGDVRERSHKLAMTFTIASIVLALAWVAYTHVVSANNTALALVLQIIAAAALIAAVGSLRAKRDGMAFASTAVAIGAAVFSFFASLYPNVMVSSTNAAYNLTVENTASGDYALKIMTIVAVIMFPIVLLYQGWTYYSFRKRVTTPPEAAEVAEPAAH
jgi:cytochrome bd ubiquinol oxidase subunit II